MRSQPRQSESIVIPFPRHLALSSRLTVRDRMDVLAWEDAARRRGYGRFVITARTPYDDPPIGDYLSIYRAGDPWASFGVARHGRVVRAWRCGSGADLGEYETTAQALAAVLRATPVDA
ncbi:MAG: hypothetical protein JO264_03500 [Acidisphaera sp.]|nr:hypothetical protein [Acidisphaera sp.]